MLVARQALIERHPWLARALLDAFTGAEAACRASYDYAKRLAFPDATLILEEQEALYGPEPWAHGLTPRNRMVLGKFVQYAADQGYVERRPALEELFAPA